ncbi:MAG TPA: hypothetical protein DGG95_09525, partial [Cytophagales bacterium]|nr:hypothetical protein [Cytophagales bacterium]
MAKSSTKSTTVKKPAKATELKIVKVSETILEKLKSLNLEPQLQSDLSWCIGSYNFDKNPSGLYTAASKALAVFNQELEKKTKGVTKKL